MSVIGIFRTTFWLLLGVILIVALMPSDGMPTVFVSDKLNHMLAFAVLAASAKCLWPRLNVVVPFLLLATYGGVIELLQWFLEFGRSADWMDFAADVLAIVLGLMAAQLINAVKMRLLATS